MKTPGQAAATAVFLAFALAGSGCAVGPDGQVDARRAADANTALGFDYLRKGYNEKALQMFTRALSYRPDNVNANWGLGIVYSRLQDDTKAEAHFRRVIDAGPNPAIVNSYGVFLCQRGRINRALYYFQRAANDASYTSPADAWANAGICLGRHERTAAAEPYLRKALKANSEHGPALAEMARLQYRDGDHLGARAFLQRRDAVTPLADDLLLLAARNELALGDPDTARGYLARYNSDHPAAEKTLEQLVSEPHD